jgi:hypothetical protein
MTIFLVVLGRDDCPWALKEARLPLSKVRWVPGTIIEKVSSRLPQREQSEEQVLAAVIRDLLYASTNLAERSSSNSKQGGLWNGGMADDFCVVIGARRSCRRS